MITQLRLITEGNITVRDQIEGQRPRPENRPQLLGLLDEVPRSTAGPPAGHYAPDERAPAVSQNSNSTLYLDRMRSMLVRAAEIRDSEQQQIFDSLDEIHGRLAALDMLGAVRKRLTELPDRTEVSVLAERLDETVGKLDAQDASLAMLARAVDAVVEKVTDKLGVSLAELDSRLEAVGGRFEGIAGRLDGLENRLSGLHKRLDELDNRLDRHESRLDGIPSAISAPMRERMDGLDSGLRSRLDEVDQGLRQHLDGAREGVRGAIVDNVTDIREGVNGRLDSLAAQLPSLTSRLDQVGDMLLKLVRQANEEYERRNASQLDEAMATVAEIILGRNSPATSASSPATTSTSRQTASAPRPAQRRGKLPKVREGEKSAGEDASTSSA
ncbi:MAG: PA containing protein [Pseudonocardiaceae bacterium]